MKDIKYIGYYATPDCNPSRNIPLAGRNKMDYTIDVLSKIVNNVEIISPATIKRGEKGCHSKVEKLKSNVSLRLFYNITDCNRLTGRINSLASRIQLLIYLIQHTNKNSIVLVYHSLALIKVISIAKYFRKFRMILELNEIYSDVAPVYEKYRDKELSITQRADAFLFPNDLMNSFFNKEGKPSVIGYGVYSATSRLANKRDDGLIHVVYAGTLDPAKGGAAAAAAAFLPENYHIHILGFGSQDLIDNLNRQITDLKRKTKCKITYDGILDGDDFTSFLQSCHIGLSTQNPDARFNGTSFPSKVLTYLANGLQVVSIDIPAISKSKLAPAISFYKYQTPQDIASAIQGVVDFSPHYDLLQQLDKNFNSDMKEVLTEFGQTDNIPNESFMGGGKHLAFSDLYVQNFNHGDVALDKRLIA